MDMFGDSPQISIRVFISRNMGRAKPITRTGADYLHILTAY